MLFQDRHLPMIRAGEKTATRRRWKDNHGRPNVGAIHAAKPDLFIPNDEWDCFVRIEAIYREPLAEMEPEDFNAEGGYTREEFIDIWKGLYGEWDPTEVVDVVEFQYLHHLTVKSRIEAHRQGDGPPVEFTSAVLPGVIG